MSFEQPATSRSMASSFIGCANVKTKYCGKECCEGRQNKQQSHYWKRSHKSILSDSSNEQQVAAAPAVIYAISKGHARVDAPAGKVRY